MFVEPLFVVKVSVIVGILAVVGERLYANVLLVLRTLLVVNALVHLIVYFDLGRGYGVFVCGRAARAERLQRRQGSLQVVLLLGANEKERN